MFGVLSLLVVQNCIGLAVGLGDNYWGRDFRCAVIAVAYEEKTKKKKKTVVQKKVAFFDLVTLSDSDRADVKEQFQQILGSTTVVKAGCEFHKVARSAGFRHLESYEDAPSFDGYSNRNLCGGWMNSLVDLEGLRKLGKLAIESLTSKERQIVLPKIHPVHNATVCLNLWMPKRKHGDFIIPEEEIKILLDKSDAEVLRNYAICRKKSGANEVKYLIQAKKQNLQSLCQQLVRKKEWVSLVVPWLEELPDNCLAEMLKDDDPEFGIARLAKNEADLMRFSSPFRDAALEAAWDSILELGTPIRDIAFQLSAEPEYNIHSFVRWAIKKGDLNIARAVVAVFIRRESDRRKLNEEVGLEPMTKEDAKCYLKSGLFFLDESEDNYEFKRKALGQDMRNNLSTLSLDIRNIIVISERNVEAVFQSLFEAKMVSIEAWTYVGSFDRIHAKFLSLSWRNAKGEMRTALLELSATKGKSRTRIDVLLDRLFRSKIKKISFRKAEGIERDLQFTIHSYTETEGFNQYKKWKNFVELGSYLGVERGIDYCPEFRKSVHKEVGILIDHHFKHYPGPHLPLVEITWLAAWSGAALLAYEKAEADFQMKCKLQRICHQVIAPSLADEPRSCRESQFWVPWEHYAWVLRTLGFKEVKMLCEPFDISKIPKGDVVVLPDTAHDPKPHGVTVVPEGIRGTAERLFAKLLYLRGLDVLKDFVPCLSCGGVLAPNGTWFECGKCGKIQSQKQTKFYQLRNTQLHKFLHYKDNLKEVIHGSRHARDLAL
eukprot:Gregarina_sp_Poly_1__1433@NODE_1358_length_4303_cov_15_668791_g910_i0_p1_GENE_NODE_1358_length_4303_cov_15_668791_g910_i0NODE_1358_length_4303_cov_15_668791_g910_i0_p1_ORF_typecomplete_len771_score88_30DUF1610/PF07754_11/3_3_NODE_1358_length_4303_cov_15_668791_g910_i012993611